MLDRNTFREAVFQRDSYKCVICGRGAPLDAHHIMERRLFDNGGYELDNGVTLCDGRNEPESDLLSVPIRFVGMKSRFYPGCHLKAEQTVLSCEELRSSAGIRHVVLPEHLYRDNRYDKWGNIINPDGTRTKGELFGDESVQKVLASANLLSVFRNRIKYPRTYHLPWSLGQTDDDRVLPDTRCFEGREVVVTEKMDGENTTLYRDYLHARSIDSGAHESRGWIKNLHAQIQADIPEGWRICGENLFAQHSLHYYNLPSYFLVISIWDQNNDCLSWDETTEYAAVLNLSMVPVLYRGIWDEKLIIKMALELDLDRQEGYVVRTARSFPYSAFRRRVAKFVRAEHVGTVHNWMMQRVVRNSLNQMTSGR